MDESSAGEPDADERGDELTEPDAVGCLEHVEILQHVRDSHETQSSREPQTWNTQVSSSKDISKANGHNAPWSSANSLAEMFSVAAWIVRSWWSLWRQTVPDTRTHNNDVPAAETVVCARDDVRLVGGWLAPLSATELMSSAKYAGEWLTWQPLVHQACDFELYSSADRKPVPTV